MLARDDVRSGVTSLLVGVAVLAISVLIVRKVGLRRTLRDTFSLPGDYLSARGSTFIPLLFMTGLAFAIVGIVLLLR